MKPEEIEDEEQIIEGDLDYSLVEKIEDSNDPFSIELVIESNSLSDNDIEQLSKNNQLSCEEDLIASGSDIIKFSKEQDLARREEMIINSILFDAKKRLNL